MENNQQNDDDFGADEAIPLVIFNEEKKSKFFISNVTIDSFWVKWRRPLVLGEVRLSAWSSGGSRHV